MTGFARIEYVFPNATIGTPPFVTGLWLFAPGAADGDDLGAALAAFADAYDDFLKPTMSSANGAGRIEGQLITEDTVYEDSGAINAPSGSGGVRAPGYSYRVVFSGSRPPRGRPNQMYWPNPDQFFYNGNGVITTPVDDYFSDWYNAAQTWLSTSPFQWRNRHFVGTDDASSSMVTGVDVRPTLTWMQRRYR